MPVVLQLAIVALLWLLAWQDHQYLAVSWLIFPALLILFITYNQLHISISEMWLNMILCLSIMAIQFGMLILYFSLKHKRFMNITKKYLGWGDILFLLVICFLLSPLNLMAFYLITLLATLLREILLKPIAKLQKANIPLAGIQAFMLSIVFIVQIFCNCYYVGNDAFIVSYLLP